MPKYWWGDGSRGKANLQSRVLLEEKVRTWFSQHCTRLFSCQMEAVLKKKKAIAPASPFSVPSLWVYLTEITDDCATQNKKVDIAMWPSHHPRPSLKP